MKELAGSAGNTFFLPDEKDGIAARIEVVLLHSEVTYHPAVYGMDKSRSIEAFRFVASVKGLRELAQHLNELADVSAKLESEIRGWTDEADRATSQESGKC